MMMIRTTMTAAVLSGLLAASAFAQGNAVSGAEPDNSGVNKAVLANGQATADDQSNAKADVELAAKVRKALVADKSLSTYGHNVKVLAKNGKVQVTGPVKSDTEMQAVTKIVTDVAGAPNVATDLSVAPK